MIRFIAFMATSVVGHCGSTIAGAPRDCYSRGFGAFPPLSDAQARSWRTAEKYCVEECRRCANCHFVSFSTRWRDCSWYEECDLKKTHTDVEGFRSRHVPSNQQDEQQQNYAYPVAVATPSRRSRSHGVRNAVDLDADGGIRRAIRLVRPTSRAQRSQAEVILVTSNENGLGNARRIADALAIVGAPEPLILAPRAAVCAAARGRPCGFSTRGALSDATHAAKEWCVLLRLRQAHLALFFAAGANVMQMDSDIAFFANPLDVLHGALRRAAIVVQWDSPIANSGFVHVKHVSNASDRVVSHLLSEWSNRMWHRSVLGPIVSTPRRAALVKARGASSETTDADDDCPNDQAILNDLLVGLSSGAFRFNQGFVVPDARRILQSDEHGWSQLLATLTAHASEPARAFPIPGEPGKPGRDARPADLRTWDERQDYWTSAMSHEVWEHHQKHRTYVDLTGRSRPSGVAAQEDECRPTALRAGALVLSVPSPSDHDPLSMVAGVGAAIPVDGCAAAGPPLHQHATNCSSASTKAKASLEAMLIAQEPPDALAGLRALHAVAPDWLIGHWSPDIIERRAACASRRPHRAWSSSLLKESRRWHADAQAASIATSIASTRTAGVACAEPVYAIHLAAYFNKPLRGLLLEAMSTRPPAHCNASATRGSSTPLLRVPHSIIGPLMRTNATVFGRFMRSIAALATANGRHVPIPRLPIGTRWAFDPPQESGPTNAETPSAVSTGCVASGSLRLWWLPLALRDDLSAFKYGKRWLFDRCEAEGGEAVLELTGAARAVGLVLASKRLRAARVVRVQAAGEAQVLEWLASAEAEAVQ